MNSYVGNALQTRGVEKYVLDGGGKGQGMHFLYVRNGLGLEAWLSLDRAGDPSRVLFKGDNMGFFAPCGYVAPQYYDREGAGFLKSFTAGFFTTCGLTAVGAPCTDGGEDLPLHGTVSHIPAALDGIEESADGLVIRLTVTEASLFGRKLTMKREYRFSYTENTFEVRDRITNDGGEKTPFMILYHCNMGYPLLDENSTVIIPNGGVTPRDDEAAKFADSALTMEKPQAGFSERCYYYDMKGDPAKAGIFGERINKGVVLSFDKTALPCFTEWKMMGGTEYVLGLEPGNCTPDGRDVLRKNGTLKFLEPGEFADVGVKFRFTDGKAEFDSSIR